MNHNYESFIKLNYQMALNFLLEQARLVDLNWNTNEKDLHLDNLKNLISWSIDHKHESVRENNKLLKLFTKDMDHKHFLTILVPLERKFSKTVYDHEFLVSEIDDIEKTKSISC